MTGAELLPAAKNVEICCCKAYIKNGYKSFRNGDYGGKGSGLRLHVKYHKYGIFYRLRESRNGMIHVFLLILIPYGERATVYAQLLGSERR
jgi:hypothetical protein